MDPAEIAYLRHVLRQRTQDRVAWRPIPGGIVVPEIVAPERYAFGTFSQTEDYGGRLIAESMSMRDAIAACEAVNALPAALDEIERLRGAGRLQLTRVTTTFGAA